MRARLSRRHRRRRLRLIPGRPPLGHSSSRRPRPRPARAGASRPAARESAAREGATAQPAPPAQRQGQRRHGCSLFAPSERVLVWWCCGGWARLARRSRGAGGGAKLRPALTRRSPPPWAPRCAGLLSVTLPLAHARTTNVLSVSSFGSGVPTSSSGAGSSSGGADADLRRREDALARREEALRRREDELRSRGGGKVRNWPRCYPLMYHDIEGEVRVPSRALAPRDRAGVPALFFCPSLSLSIHRTFSLARVAAVSAARAPSHLLLTSRRTVRARTLAPLHSSARRFPLSISAW